jgi:hypothetical protein
MEGWYLVMPRITSDKQHADAIQDVSNLLAFSGIKNDLFDKEIESGTWAAWDFEHNTLALVLLDRERGYGDDWMFKFVLQEFASDHGLRRETLIGSANSKELIVALVQAFYHQYAIDQLKDLHEQEAAEKAEELAEVSRLLEPVGDKCLGGCVADCGCDTPSQSTK